MIRSLQWWKVAATLATLSVGAKSMNSLNMVFEDFNDIDLTPLGTPNLDAYDVEMDFSVDEWETGECIYTIHIDFDPNKRETEPGTPEFLGNCFPDDKQGDGDDGKTWHGHRRHWMRLPEHMVEATGLNHFSMEWLPCGRAPLGFRQARWDLVFYTVIPEYRAFMICDTFNSAANLCQWNQTTHLGRRMFTISRLAQDNRNIANIPLYFGPDPEFPEAYEYEGLTHYSLDPTRTPQNYTNWTLPTHTMTTYDSETVSFRAMIPHRYYSDPKKAWVRSSEYQFYVYQTQMGLPSNWTTYYDRTKMQVKIKGNVLKNSRSHCKRDPNWKKDKPEIIFSSNLKEDQDLHK